MSQAESAVYASFVQTVVQARSAGLPAQKIRQGLGQGKAVHPVAEAIQPARGQLLSPIQPARQGDRIPELRFLHAAQITFQAEEAASRVAPFFQPVSEHQPEASSYGLPRTA